MSSTGSQERREVGGDGQQYRRVAAPLLPEPPAAMLPSVMVTTPPEQNSITRDAWKEQEAAAERRAAGISEPPPVYDSSSSSAPAAPAPAAAQNSDPVPTVPGARRPSLPTADVTAAAVAIAAAAQAPRHNRTRSSTIASHPEEKGTKVDDRKWYSKKRTFFALTASLIVILVVALVCNYVVFKNQGRPDGGNWHRHKHQGSDNGTDVSDGALANWQNQAWQGKDKDLMGLWTIGNVRLDSGADGGPIDECAPMSGIFVPCSEGRFIKPTEQLKFNISQPTPGFYEGTFSSGIFGNETETMNMRPSRMGITTNYEYGPATGKKNSCIYGRGMQILLTVQPDRNGDGKTENVYKITETQVISGDGCAADGGNNGDVCTCTYIGARA